MWCRRGSYSSSQCDKQNLSMGTNFILQDTFWLKGGLRVYLDLYVADFQKSISKYFFILVLFSPKHSLLEAFSFFLNPL